MERTIIDLLKKSNYLGIDTTAIEIAKANELNSTLIPNNKKVSIPLKVNPNLSNRIFTFDKNNDRLGKDISVDKNRDIKTTNKGDLAVLSGIRNYESSINRKLNTVIGSIFHSSNYGFDVANSIGRPTLDLVITTLRMKYKECIFADPRTNEVNDIIININKGELRITSSIGSIGGRVEHEFKL